MKLGVSSQFNTVPGQPPLFSQRNVHSPSPVRRRISPTRRIVVLSLIVLIIAGVTAGTWLVFPAILVQITHVSTPAPTTIASTATPNPTSAPDSPSGLPIVPDAAYIITNVQTSSAVDDIQRPAQVTSIFTSSQTIFITFTIQFNGQGTIEAKFYADGQPLPDFTNTLKIYDSVNHFGELPPGGFGAYNSPTQGAAELYWCPQFDCNNEELAAFVYFTVTQ